MARMRSSFLALAPVLAIWLLVGCAGGGASSQEEDAQKESAAELVAGSFVGKADPSEHAFVAVVASEAEEGAEGRDVEAYMCDPARGINEWFWGTVTGNELNLTSENGASIEGDLADDATTGTVTLDDGQSFSFTADPATGFSGLYTVSVSSDGSFTGASETGGQVEGQTGPEGSANPQHVPEGIGGGMHAVTGTLMAPDGESREFEISAPTFRPGGASEFEAFYIVSGTHIVGGTKQGKSGTSYMDPNCMW